VVDLVFTTDAFAPHGFPRPGVPMLLDQEMRLIEPACGWLLHVALVRGRTRSRETWRTYGEALFLHSTFRTSTILAIIATEAR